MKRDAEQSKSGAINWIVLAVALVATAGALAAEYRNQVKSLEEAKVKLKLTEQETQFKESLEQMRKAHMGRMAELAAEHKFTLEQRLPARAEAAKERRAAEWRARLWHDPALVTTSMEHALLRMEQLGRDSSLATKDVLAEVAKLASPPGSRIEVTQAGAGHRVQVAFRMAAVSEREAGAVTKHQTTETMRAEVQEVSAHIVRALFEFCGTRGIQSVTLTCNHAMQRSDIPAGATEAERKSLLAKAPVTMGALYRVTVDGERAAAILNWREISSRQLSELMRVEYDGIETLAIMKDLPETASQDPDLPLEF